jgi:hypothetical protein
LPATDTTDDKSDTAGLADINAVRRPLPDEPTIGDLSDTGELFNDGQLVEIFPYFPESPTPSEANPTIPRRKPLAPIVRAKLHSLLMKYHPTMDFDEGSNRVREMYLATTSNDEVIACIFRIYESTNTSVLSHQYLSALSPEDVKAVKKAPRASKSRFWWGIFSRARRQRPRSKMAATIVDPVRINKGSIQ